MMFVPKKLLLIFTWSSTFLPSMQDCGTLVTDFSQSTCISRATDDATYYYVEDKDTCLPKCEPYKDSYSKIKQGPCPPPYERAHRCLNSGFETSCTEDTDCKGDARDAVCQEVCVIKDGPSCMAYHVKNTDFQNTYYTAMFKPKCENNGDWQAKQCKGGVTGRCFCFDKKGTRIFGQALYSESHDMTCACSRKKADLEAGGRSFVSFHCDSKGNYEPLQCDSGMCWCVEPQSGDLTSPVVPQKAMNKLPCYDLSEVGNQYLRQCDSIKYATEKISDTLKLHGVVYTNMPPILCDFDGAYGAYNLTGGIAQCIWRDGKTLGNYRTESGTDLRAVTCNCARDTKLYGQTLSCAGSGDYNSIQFLIRQQQAQFYCVDSDGFIKSQLFSERPGNCSIFY